jgi:hypothetical protein
MRISLLDSLQNDIIFKGTIDVNKTFAQFVKTKRRANFTGFKRFRVIKGLVEQKNVVFNSFVCKLGFFGTRGHLKRSFHSRFKMVHSCQKRPNLHTNSSNKLLFTLLHFFNSAAQRNVAQPFPREATLKQCREAGIQFFA